MNTTLKSHVFSLDWIKENTKSQELTFQELTQPVDEELDLLEAEENYDYDRAVQTAAYHLFLQRQRYHQSGDALSDWLEAERTVKKDRDRSDR